MAKEKGYYRDSGLEVEIKPYQAGLDIAKDVISKKSTYGIGGSSLIINAGKGAKIKFLMSTLQSSPLIFLTTKESNITSIADLKGKRIMTVSGADVAIALYAMMRRAGVERDDLIYLKDSFDVNDLVNKKTDIMMGYESNEPFLLHERGVEYTIFDPKNYGFDFYNDILYTSEAEVIDNPKRALEFRDASLRGWKYALEHIDETIDLILEKYNTQHKSRQALLYEANILKRLAYAGNKELGVIEKEKLQRIYDIYNISGFIKTPFDVNEMVWTKSTVLVLTKTEEAYLRQKKRFTLCVQPDFFPIDGIRSGIHTGIAADVDAIIAKKLGIDFLPLASKNRDELVKNINEKKCDLVSIVNSKQRLSPNITLTQPFISSYLAFISKVNKPFISDIGTLRGKRIVVRHLLFKNYLLQFDPCLTIDVVNSLDAMAKKVQKDEAYCIALPYESAEWLIQEYGIGKLKVNGFTNIDKPMDGSIGIVGNNTVLLSILNKTLQTIPQETIDQIKGSWALKNYSEPVNYRVALWIALASLIIFIAFLHRQRTLNQLNSVLEESVLKRTAELEASKKLLETIFNTTKESIAIVDKNTIFTFANKAYFEMTGYNELELYQKSCLELTVEEDMVMAKKALETARHQGYLNNIEKRCTQQNGTVIETRTSVIAMPNSDNFLIICNDITEENRLTREHSAQEQQMLQQSRLAQMGEMIAMIAHQWRQPLGAIASTAVNMKLKLELRSFDIETQEGRDALNRFFMERLTNVEQYVENLTTTIDDFRNFYKPDKKLVMISIKAVVYKALKIIRTSMENENIEIIEAYVDEREWEIYDNEMTQVILNILKNAQDNFKEKEIEYPRIQIKTEKNTLSICDNGGGISKEIIGKIFDPYFSTKNEKNGTGLGLYMSKVIIEEHHKGSLIAKNNNGGVCFNITLGGR